MYVENTDKTEERKNVPRLGLSSREHSVISLPSSSVIISTASSSVYTLHARKF